MDQLAQRDRLLATGGGAGKRSHEDSMDVEGGGDGDAEGEGAEHLERRALREFGLEEAGGYPAPGAAMAQDENKDESQGIAAR
jgi:hypothetical protein